ncbi:hypothetical protein BT63DRAFT_419416 [Microthyrium microscopicum]|uniref:Transmembrane protein n=1 Tax=Microthyrium microscopicum TaxID=703497 RepID=A0A6A6UPA2_9PEZI|nr:hypothetical protein BT63DRAFT_419416 [Microthyrium microscopicum]
MTTNNDVQPATRFFEIQEENGICNTPQSMILFHLTLWIAPALCQFILGNSILREKISIRSPRLKKNPNKRNLFLWRTLFQIGHYLLRLILENVFAATILTKAATSITFRNAFLIWVARPQPSSFLTLISMSDYHMFALNAMENQYIESFLGFFSIGLFVLMQKSLAPQRIWMNHQRDITSAEHTGYIRMRDGSKFGIALFAFQVFVLVYVLPDIELKAKAYAKFVVLSSLLNFIRMILSFVIWVAVPMLDSSAFCPSAKTTGALIGLSAVISMLDHLWRAMISDDDEDGAAYRTALTDWLSP